MAVKPIRLQLSRRRGFDLQALSMATNGLPAVVVARPTKWGNPFSTVSGMGRCEAVDAFQRWLTEDPCLKRARIARVHKAFSGGGGLATFLRMRVDMHELRGKNLACWCPHDGQPCHADVLLDIANAR